MGPVSAARSRNMSLIKSKNTKPELRLRKTLHALGFRYRLHNKELPGRLDIVLRRWHAAIFVNGCFWHGHNCKDFRWPKTRPDFWRAKIGGNQARDRAIIASLASEGWRVMIVWECSLRRLPSAMPVALKVAAWLKSDDAFSEVTEQV
jgi:DNA mismatch endonuclease, patch repair protein